MGRLFLLRPEIAGEHAPAVEFANNTATDAVRALAHRLSGWSGDELLASQRGTVVTADLALRLAEADITGFKLSDVIYSPASENVPRTVFTKIEPLGFVLLDEEFQIQSWSGHDICASPSSELVVSDKVLEILRDARFSNCGITPLAGID